VGVKIGAQRIVAIANQLRQEWPNQYGIKGAKPGNPDYIKDGWKNAVKTATELYYRDTGKTPKAKKQMVTCKVKCDPRMDALYRGFLNCMGAMEGEITEQACNRLNQVSLNKNLHQRDYQLILPYGNRRIESTIPLTS